MARKPSSIPQGLDELSVVIGELKANQLTHSTLLVEVKNTLHQITAQLPNLPPSPVCVAKHKEIDEKLADMDKRVTWLSAKISAVVAALAAGLKIGAAKLGVDI